MKYKNIQTEIDAGYLYTKLAENEGDETIANVFRKMSDIEKDHAEAFARKENINVDGVKSKSILSIRCVRLSYRVRTSLLINSFRANS